MEVLEFIDFTNRDKVAITALSEEKPEKHGCMRDKEDLWFASALETGFPTVSHLDFKTVTSPFCRQELFLVASLCTFESCSIILVELEFKE